MTRIRPTLSRRDVAAIVCSKLASLGINVVLCGGAVVSIYSSNRYESYDLDFVSPNLARNVAAGMKELGFKKEGRHWVHADTPFWVEFPPGPVEVGNIIVTEFAEMETDFGVLRILPPTECVIDRLAGYFHWNDPQCLEQALLVASEHPIDLARIKAWAKSDAIGNRIHEFLDRLRK